MNEQAVISTNAYQYIMTALNSGTALVVYSPTSLGKATGTKESFLNNSMAIPSREGFHLPVPPLERYEQVIGFGGGTAIDIAKFIASALDLPCTAVPSMLSTNVFATDKCAVITDGKKHTEQGVLPVRIIYDNDLLSLSNLESLYGLADAFSIRTALTDWEIADTWGKEDINIQVYEHAKQVLNDALALADIFYNEEAEISKFMRRSIFEVLRQAGYVTNEYGNGRPESGSEHIIATRIEELIHIPHAIAVAAGIAIASQLQGCYDIAVRPLKYLGVFDAVKEYITPEILEQALQNAKPRPGRFTVLDKCFSPCKIPALIQFSGLFKGGVYD